jgi:hypothetical protein
MKPITTKSAGKLLLISMAMRMQGMMRDTLPDEAHPRLY